MQNFISQKGIQILFEKANTFQVPLKTHQYPLKKKAG